MDKDALLKSIADTGYNVGFGAKKHFATFDIVEKAPGWIGFVSSACGIFGLVYESLSSKFPSAALAVLGISALYISFYRSKKYDEAGRKLTHIFTQLRDLYRSVQAGADVQTSYVELQSLEQRFYNECISKQILFSDWFAHYKFFAQHQIEWIEEQKTFTWKDKIPLSLRVFLTILLVVGGFIFFMRNSR